jgi:hypothetical protein
MLLRETVILISSLRSMNVKNNVIFFYSKGKKDPARSPTKILKSTTKSNGQFPQIPQPQLLQQQQHNYSELPNNNNNNRISQNQTEDTKKRSQTLQSLSSGSERLNRKFRRILVFS